MSATSSSRGSVQVNVGREKSKIIVRWGVLFIYPNVKKKLELTVYLNDSYVVNEEGLSILVIHSDGPRYRFLFSESAEKEKWLRRFKLSSSWDVTDIYKFENRYILRNLQGTGKTNYIAVHDESGVRMAIKVCKDPRLALKQVQVMSRCEHPNVMHFTDAFISRKGSYIVTPLLYPCRRHHTNKRRAYSCAYQILKGLKYLRARGIVHGDLHFGHVLSTREFCYKICGFHSHEPRITTLSAPEIRRKEAYSYPADVYTAGMMLLHDLARVTSSDEEESKESLLQDRNICPLTRDLITKMTAENPAERIRASEALKHEVWDTVNPHETLPRATGSIHVKPVNARKRPRSAELENVPNPRKLR